MSMKRKNMPEKEKEMLIFRLSFLDNVFDDAFICIPDEYDEQTLSIMKGLSNTIGQDLEWEKEGSSLKLFLLPAKSLGCILHQEDSVIFGATIPDHSSVMSYEGYITGTNLSLNGFSSPNDLIDTMTECVYDEHHQYLSLIPSYNKRQDGCVYVMEGTTSCTRFSQGYKISKNILQHLYFHGLCVSRDILIGGSPSPSAPCFYHQFFPEEPDMKEIYKTTAYAYSRLSGQNTDKTWSKENEEDLFLKINALFQERIRNIQTVAEEHYEEILILGYQFLYHEEMDPCSASVIPFTSKISDEEYPFRFQFVNDDIFQCSVFLSFFTDREACVMASDAAFTLEWPFQIYSQISYQALCDALMYYYLQRYPNDIDLAIIPAANVLKDNPLEKIPFKSVFTGQQNG